MAVSVGQSGEAWWRLRSDFHRLDRTVTRLPDGSGRLLMSLLPLYALGAPTRPSTWRLLLGISVLTAAALQLMFNLGGQVL